VNAKLKVRRWSDVRVTQRARVPCSDRLASAAEHVGHTARHSRPTVVGAVAADNSRSERIGGGDKRIEEWGGREKREREKRTLNPFEGAFSLESVDRKDRTAAELAELSSPIDERRYFNRTV